MPQARLRPILILRLAAPHTWAASILPVLFAAALAFSDQEASLPFDMFYLVLAIGVLMQAAVNTLNDYHDFRRGTDTYANSPERGDAVLVYEDINPASARNLGFAFLGLALILGLYLVWLRGWVPLLLGCTGAAVVLLYSWGRYPLSYLPLGELASALTMGYLLPLAAYQVLTGELSGRLFLLALPLMLGIALIMLSNNSCDIERDRRAGRRTLPLLLGAGRLLFYRTLLLIWLLVLLLLSWLSFRGGFWLWPLLILASLGSYGRLFRLPLTAQQRPQVMRAILRANWLLNGGYILIILLKRLAGGGLMAEKPSPQEVQALFQRIAPGYDAANQRISLGQQQRWKRRLMQAVLASVPADGAVLDVCCGSGDIAIGLARQAPGLRVTGLDFSPAMLEIARAKAPRQENLLLIEGDAMRLPCTEDSYDAVTISFGLRNTPDPALALAELHRVCKPGGWLFCLDSCVPEAAWLRPFYRLYFGRLMPRLGGGKAYREEYRYLHRSTAGFLRESELRQLFTDSGLREVGSRHFCGGAAVLCSGRK